MGAKDSLITQAKQQMELMPSSAMPDRIFREGERALAGEFTGERLFARDPEKYQLIVSLLAEGVGILKIAELLKVSPGTVTAVRDREGVPIGIVKEGLAKLCHAGAALALEGAVEQLSDRTKRGKVPVRDLAVAAAVMIDKGQLLSGEATSRLEIADITPPDHDDWNAYVAGLRAAKPAGMGLGWEKPGQKGAAGSGPGVVAGATGEQVIEVGTDKESEGKDANV